MKLPYPKFMETDYCVIYGGSVDGGLNGGLNGGSQNELWRGKCYFAWRTKGDQKKDGTDVNVSAKVTIGCNIMGILGSASHGSANLGSANHGDIKLSMEKHGRLLDFAVRDVRPAYNPDGSLHHIALGLVE